MNVPLDTPMCRYPQHGRIGIWHSSPRLCRNSKRHPFNLNISGREVVLCLERRTPAHVSHPFEVERGEEAKEAVEAAQRVEADAVQQLTNDDITYACSANEALQLETKLAYPWLENHPIVFSTDAVTVDTWNIKEHQQPSGKV